MTTRAALARVLVLLGASHFASGDAIHAQTCTLGADLSYVNAVEDAGGVYRDTAGRRVDPYAYFAARGCDLVRLRLWYDPTRVDDACGGQIRSGGLADALRGARRADSAGMDLMLALHYSDYFADPGKQPRPSAWTGLAGQRLRDSIRAYTTRVLEAFAAQGTVPAILAVGNETTNGFVDETPRTDGFDWAEDAGKFRAGLAAVTDFNARTGHRVRSAIHLTAGYVEFGAAEFARRGITDYDILGVSFSPHFDPDLTLAGLGARLRAAAAASGKEVMLLETGFQFSTAPGDGYGEFLGGNGDVIPFATSPEGQLTYLHALVDTVRAAGATGVVYWEPAWVTSDLCDAWGRGSSYESATFFDYRDGNRALPAFRFFEACGTSGAGDARFRQNGSVGPVRVRVVAGSEGRLVLHVAAEFTLDRIRVSDAAGRELVSLRVSPPTREVSLPLRGADTLSHAAVQAIGLSGERGVARISLAGP